MYAKLSQCQEWHKEYCRLYWLKNELQLIGTEATMDEAAKLERRMKDLITLLGYTPAP